MSKQKAKGTAAETAVADYLREWFPHVKREPLKGSADTGDIDLFTWAVIEVKNHQRMQLAEWIDEATTEGRNRNSWLNVVWHKRVRKGSPADWYVSMRGETFKQLLLLVDGYLSETETLEQLLKSLGGNMEEL
jgi:hypothetical protein